MFLKMFFFFVVFMCFHGFSFLNIFFVWVFLDVLLRLFFVPPDSSLDIF